MQENIDIPGVNDDDTMSSGGFDPSFRPRAQSSSMPQSKARSPSALEVDEFDFPRWVSETASGVPADILDRTDQVCPSESFFRPVHQSEVLITGQKAVKKESDAVKRNKHWSRVRRVICKLHFLIHRCASTPRWTLHHRIANQRMRCLPLAWCLHTRKSSTLR